MPRVKNSTVVSDGSDEKLAELISGFSTDCAVRWLRKKFTSFDTSLQTQLALGDSKNEQSFFTEIQKLGYVTELKLDNKNEVNKPLVVVAIRMKKDLSERTSRSIQFNCAKRLLKEEVECGQHHLTGMPSQGIFFFYDDNGHFRISFVTGEVENRRFKFNEAKRQSFFVEPGAPNNIVKRRLNIAIKTYTDLKDAFSVEKLTKEFYDKLFQWYEWALELKTGVTFPNDIAVAHDDRKQLSEALIRLITRLMFVWFIRQRGIVPNEFFDSAELKKIIRDFKPTSMEQDNYYRVILQNLFFATLNCQPARRKFAKSFHGRSNERGVKTCYRYAEELFSPDDFIKRMEPVPFLNCALFDCLDKTERPQDGGREILLDGFSSKRPKQAHVPNGLFFHEEKGLVKLFNLYEFTVDENNADDSDVALDPELLGKVFENLLGAFNPETQETARKATGSFYTPREIVDYMVEESLRNYLKSKVKSADDERLDDLFDRTRAIENAPTKFSKNEVNALLDALYNCKILDPACGSGAFPMGVLHCMVRLFSRLDPGNIRQREIILQRYREETAENVSGLSESERKERAEILNKQLEEGRLYPDYARKLYLIENCIYGVDIQPIATQISKLRFFISLLCDQLRTSWDPNAANYGLLSLPNLEAKFVCANTLLALPKVNGGEFALSTDGIQELKEALQKNRHKIFFARTADTKAKYKEKDQELRDQIKAAVRTQLSTPNEAIIDCCEKEILKARMERTAVAEPKMELQEQFVGADLFTEGKKQWVEVDVHAEKRNALDARIKNAQRIIAEERNKVNLKSTGSTAIDKLAAMVAGWDPYDQNACSDFFDPEWMFNIKDGFDIVIGNPPYVEAKKLKSTVVLIKDHYTCYSGTADLSVYFYERGLALSAKGGTLSYICTNKFFSTGYGQKLRAYLLVHRLLGIWNFEQCEVFEGILVSSVITLLEKSNPPSKELDPQIRFLELRNLNHKDFIKSFTQNLLMEKHYPLKFLSDSEWSFSDASSLQIKQHLEYGNSLLAAIPGIQIYRGVTTGYNPAFIINNEQRDALLRADRNNKDIIKNMLQGRNIRKWVYIESDENLIFSKQGINIKKYPKIESYLMQFYAELRPKKDENDSGGRKPGSYRWYEIQDNTAYYPEFEREEKIIWGLTADKWAFAYDDQQHYLPSNGYILTSTKLPIKYVLGLLNSSVLKFYFSFIGVMTAGGAYTLKHTTISQLPIPEASKEQQKQLIAIVDRILNNKTNDSKADVSALETEMDKLIYQLYGLSNEEIAIVEGSAKQEPEPVEQPEEPVKKPKCQKSRRSSDEEEYLE